jgi:hypothetical protein
VSRVLTVVGGVVLLAAGIVALALAFGAHDSSQIGGAATPAASSDRHLPPGRHAQVPAGQLPIQGAHRPELITHDARRLTDDQILHALELGDVVLVYDASKPPAPLVKLQRDLTGPFDAELSAAGQAVVLAQRPGSGPAAALAWGRDVRAQSASDPRLRAFAEQWLGRGVKG